MDPLRNRFEERYVYFSISVQRDVYEVGIRIKFGKHDQFVEDKSNAKNAIFFNCLKKYYKDKTDQISSNFKSMSSNELMNSVCKAISIT